MERRHSWKWTLYCVLVCTFYTPQVVYSKSKNNCTKIDNCSCKFDDGSGTMSLSRLGKPSGDPLIKDATGSSGQYSFNPCYPFTEGTCLNAAGCQYDTTIGLYYNIGDAEKVEFSIKGGNVVGTYTSDDGYRTSKVTYVCDLGADQPVLEVTGEDPPYSLQYSFKITSKEVCPQTTSPTDGPSVTVNVEAKLSAGWILIIVVLSLALLYIVAGVLFNKLYRKASGREVVPNQRFWSGLPGYVKDGICFTYAKIRRAEYHPI